MKFISVQRNAERMQRNAKRCREKCREMKRNAEKCIYAFMNFIRHGNVIFDILEPHALLGPIV